MVQSSRKALLVATTRARFLLDLFLITTCISRASSIVNCENCDRNCMRSGVGLRVLEATYGAKVSKLQSRWGGITMTIFSEGRGRVIDVNPSPALRLLGIAVVGFLVALLLFSSVAKVESGNVGVLTLFGRVTGEVLPEGVHLVYPFKSNNEMSIRTQEIKESASVPSAEGLVMNLDTSLIYHLDPEKAADVYQKIGPNYRDVFIEPNLRAAIREATASHSANALYSGERELVAKQIRDQLTTLLGQRGILVESILLRDIQLPQTLKVSIEAKQQAEQEALAMSFRLQKEKQEAERKRIEAAGIRDFQQIVAQGISPQLLEWKGIEATENLAKSANAKGVVIGNPKNGLPLILGGQ